MRGKIFSFFVGIVLLAAAHSMLRADVTLPTVLADHMVIQRNRPVHVWGMADPGETVTVEFRGNHSSMAANKLGQWSLYLPPGEAGGPFPLTIRGKNTIRWNDVLVGDVWIASGQSNMEFFFNWSYNATEELNDVDYPNLRMFQIPRARNDATALDDVTAIEVTLPSR